jgi:hypothetical protein
MASTVDDKPVDYTNNENPSFINPMIKNKSDNENDINMLNKNPSEEKLNEKRDDDKSNLEKCRVSKDATSDVVLKGGTVENSITILRKSRCWVFVYLVSLNICLNFVDGVIPASTDKVETDLKISKVELGLFGSLIYIGDSVGKINI